MIATINPATGETVKTFESASSSELAERIAAPVSASANTGTPV